MLRHTAEELALMPPDRAAAIIRRAKTSDLQAWSQSWRFWRLAAQAEPEGDWRIWLVMAGRGFGKTRMGAEWVRERAESDGDLRIALVAATIVEARAVMIEGESGLLACAANGMPVRWEPSLRKLSWDNGAEARIYSAAEPEALRGPQHHMAWADEIAKWPYALAAWDNLMMGLRLGTQPQAMATTTPRPVPLLKQLHGAADVRLTRGRTADNAANLPLAYLRAMKAEYGNRRIGRQELDGELIEDAEGALWTRARLEDSALPRWAVTLRKREGIGPDTRLVWRGRFLAVRGALSDPRDPSRLVLTCEEMR